MQPLYADAISPLLPALSQKLLLFPSISFPAFQPDQCYVRIKGTFSEVSGPLGPYHSSIVYYAWRAGMSAQQTADLFCDAVYQELRFYDYWDSATQALLEEGARCDMPLEGLLTGYERGAALVKLCRDKLEAVEGQIRVLDQGIMKPWIPE